MMKIDQWKPKVQENVIEKEHQEWIAMVWCIEV